MEAGFHICGDCLGWERDEVLKRGAGLQGLVDDGLIWEMEMMRSLVLGGERVASYSKKIYSIGKFFHLIKWTSDR
jgi:hypothetical protein